MTLGEAIGNAILWFFLREIIAGAIVILFYAIGGLVAYKKETSTKIKGDGDGLLAGLGIAGLGWILALVWQIVAVVFLVGDIATIVNIVAGVK